MNAARLNIAIEVDDKGSVKIRQIGKVADEAGRKAEGGFKRAGRSLGELHEKTTTSLGSMKALMGAMAGAAATVALVNVSRAAIKAASDLQEVSSKFDVVFKGQEQQAAQWSKTLVDSYAMSTRESKLYLSSVQDLLVPMGMAADQAGAMSNEVVKLSADLGSFNNLPTAQVMDDIQSALVGNYETMKKYGVVLNATAVQQKALDMGLASTVKQLTAADKAQAAYKLMVEGSTAAIGDHERTQGSYANQLKKTQSRIEMIQAAIGQGLLPIMSDLLGEFNDWYEINGELLNQDLQEWAGLVGESIEEIATATRSTINALAEFKPVADSITGALGGYGASAKYGIVGYALFGPAGPMKIVAMLEVVRGAIPKVIEFNKQLANEQQRVVDTLLGLNDAWEGSVGYFNSAGDALEDLGDDVNGLEQFYVDLTKTVQVSAKETCDANKKALTCTEKRAKKEAEAKKKAAQEAYKTQAGYLRELTKRESERAEKAKKLQESLNSDIDRLMSDQSELWVGTTAQTTTEMENYWVDFSESTKDVLHDFVESGIKLEFDSIDDAFSSLTDSLLNMFADMLAQMIANWAASGIMGIMSGQGLSGFSMPSFGGSGSGAGMPSISGSGAGMGTVGGTLAVAGGAYGMYQGGRDISNGNYVQGAAELGAGGYSMYQGGVALGYIPSGTATSLWNSATGGWSMPGLGGQTTVTYGQSGTQTLGSLGGGNATLGGSYAPGHVPQYLAAAPAGYGGSMLAGQQTMMAAQGAYSGVGASGIGSGQGMLASYAGSGSAPGAGAGAGAGAGIGSAAMTAGAYAAIAYGAYRIISGILEMDEATPHSALSMLSAQSQRQRTDYARSNFGDPSNMAADEYSPGGGLAGIIDAMSTYSDAIAKMYDNMLEGAGNLVDGWNDYIQSATDSLDASFNVSGVERFIEAMGGFDISTEQAAHALDLASEAANGNMFAVDELQGYYVSLGMTLEQASAATAALLEVERRHGNVAEESMKQIRNATFDLNESMASSADALHVYNDALEYSEGVMNGSTESIMSGSYAMEQLHKAAQELGNTRIDMEANARINVDVRGLDNSRVSASTDTSSTTISGGNSGMWWSQSENENYDGGIFLSRSVFRPGQSIAERGPEAALPLHDGPDTLKKMHEDIKSIGNRPIIINVTGDENGLRRFIQVETDSHVADRNRRGLTTERAVY